MIDYFRDASKTEIIFIVAILVILVFAVIGAYHEQKEWQQFAIDYNCRPVKHIKGKTSVAHGYGHKGGYTPIVISEPDQTCYLCDDGQEYCR